MVRQPDGLERPHRILLLTGERSERIGALERGFSSPTRPLIIVVFQHSRRKGNDHAQEQKPSQRRKPEQPPQQPRDRLAEIRAEIQDVQQQIETKRRDGHVIRTAEDFKSFKRAIAALTNRLSALLVAEATQAALDDSENRPRPAPWLKGRASTIKDQGRRDVTLQTTCGQIIVRVTYFSRNCDRSKAGKGMYPMLLLWGVQDRCTAAIASEISKLVAMLGSLQEVEQVLSDRGQPLNFKTIRTIAYRFATRARAAQRVGNLDLEKPSRAVGRSSPPMVAGFGFARPSVVPRPPRDATAIAPTGASRSC